jgi:hypothetical protein
MVRGSSVLRLLVLLGLLPMTIHCGAEVSVRETGSPSTVRGALLGSPDPALIRLMVRAHSATAEKARIADAR